MVVRTFSGSRLNQLRLRRGYTQDDFAHALRNSGLRTTAKQIRRWESEAHAPRSSVVPILADALGVSIDELYGEPDDEESHQVMLASLSPMKREKVERAVVALTEVLLEAVA